MMLLCAGPAAEGKYSGGTGEPNDPYRIATPEDLNDIGKYEEDWDKHFVLINDVNLAQYTGTQFNIIGEFKGVFDGNDHRIWNFTWTSGGIGFVGMFRCVGPEGKIKNLGLENVNINAQVSVGGLVALNYGAITNCYSTGSVSGSSCVGGLVGGNDGTIINCHSSSSVSGGMYIGGLVQYNGGTIINCYSTGTVVGESEIGGLVAHNEGTITGCYSRVTVLSNEDCVGGLVGKNLKGTIANCYTTGSVSATGAAVGGLVGTNQEGIITNCYSSGSVDGSWDFVGGLAGDNFYGTITNCYSTASVAGRDCVGGLVGGNAGTISSCYSSASVSGGSGVGGLVGQNGDLDFVYQTWNEIPGYIYNCYSTGEVTGSSNVGGLVGVHIAGEVGASFWDVETSDCNTSAGGTGKTTAEMKTMSTFTDAGWDFVEIWGIGENQTYPFLLTESAGDLNHDKKVDLTDLAILASHWLQGAGP